MNDEIFRCLVLPGGGMKGRITAEFLYPLDQRIREMHGVGIYEYFDMFSATSTGGIILAAMVLGIPIPVIRQMYHDGKKLFVRGWMPWTPKYKSKPILDTLRRESIRAGGNPDMTMGDIMRLHKKYVQIVSVNKRFKPARNVYFKSWKSKWDQLKVIDAAQYTFSAAFYFGNSNNWIYKMVFGDGGEGNQNCPLQEAINSIKRLGKRKGKVRVLKVGVGQYEELLPMKKAARHGKIREVLPVAMMAQGQAPISQVYSAVAEQWDDNFKFSDVDVDLPNKKLTKLDGIKYIPEYEQLGQKMAETHLDETVKFLAG